MPLRQGQTSSGGFRAHDVKWSLPWVLDLHMARPKFRDAALRTSGLPEAGSCLRSTSRSALSRHTHADHAWPGDRIEVLFTKNLRIV